MNESLENIQKVNRVGIIGRGSTVQGLLKEKMNTKVEYPHLYGESRSVGIPVYKTQLEEFIEMNYPPVGKGKRKVNKKKKTKKRRK